MKKSREEKVVLSISIRKDILVRAEKVMKALGFRKEEQEERDMFFETLIEESLEGIEALLDKAGLTKGSKERKNRADKNAEGRDV